MEHENGHRPLEIEDNKRCGLHKLRSRISSVLSLIEYKDRHPAPQVQTIAHIPSDCKTLTISNCSKTMFIHLQRMLYACVGAKQHVQILRRRAPLGTLNCAECERWWSIHVQQVVSPVTLIVKV
jgi:hypothetical protein